MRKIIFNILFVCLVLNLNLVKAQSYKPLPEHSFTVSAFPNFGWLKYRKNDVHSKGDFNMGYGLTYRRQLSERWLLALGMDYRTYTGIISFDGLRDSVPMQDWEDDRGYYHKYYFIQIFNNTEEQKVTYFEPSIRLNHIRPLNSFVHFVVGFGVKYGLNLHQVGVRLEMDNLLESNRMTAGTYERNAYFYENNNFIDILSSVYLNTFPDFHNPIETRIFKHSFFALGEIGFRFSLSPRWYLKTMFNVQHSLLNVQAEQDNLLWHWYYRGFAASKIPGGVRAISAGMEIGLSYRFVIQPKPFIPKKVGSIHCPR